MAATRPEYWAMDYLDHKIGHGLFEIRPRRLPSPPSPAATTAAASLPEEQCAVCHRPRDGRFEGVVGDLRGGMSRGCRLCDALHQFVVAVTQEPHQVSHPFRLEIRKGSPAILEICVATVIVGDVYTPQFAKYQIFFQARFADTMFRRIDATKRPPSLSAFDSIGFGSPVAASSRSIQCLSFARAALDQCLNKHGDCGQSSGDPELPTRVLDLGLDDSAIKLLEPTPGTRARYVALSHCWGAAGAKRLETKQASLEGLKSSVPWTALPPTFQDAVTVARCVGIRYLWIDSLCIIQDSAADWEIESSRMASVYRESTVTVAAVSSASSDEPFLAPRSRVLQERLLLLGLSRADRQLSAEELGLVAPHVIGTAPSYALGIRPLAVHTTAGPLSTRAWTFQEEKLSARILRFSATELSYECRRGVACECDMHGADYDNAPAVPGLPPLHGLAITEKTDVDAGEAEGLEAGRPQQPPLHLDPFLAWQNRVAEYSRRRLTFASDKLPALAGLAAVCHAITKSAYLGGLWKDHLLLDLLWRPASNRRFGSLERGNLFCKAETAAWKTGMAIAADKLPDPVDLSNCYISKLRKAAAHENLLVPRVAEAFGTPLASEFDEPSPSPVGFVKDYRAPTFSWASVDCPVEFRTVNHPDVAEMDIEATVLDAQCVVDGLNPFGRVSDGYVVLRGPLLRVEISTRPLRRNYGTYVLKHGDVAVEFRPDLPLALDADSSSPTTEPRVRRAAAEDDPHVRFEGLPVWCLKLLRSSDSSSSSPSMSREIVILVLGRSARVPGAYERLGLIDASSAPGSVQQQQQQLLDQWFAGGEQQHVRAPLTEIRCV
ncbi:hypothetical protein Hte_009186 [Hypoxylon texense]